MDKRQVRLFLLPLEVYGRFIVEHMFLFKYIHLIKHYICHCLFFVASFALFLGLRLIHFMLNGTGNKETVASLLVLLIEVVHTTMACECVYVREMVIKALIWMQSPQETFAEVQVYKEFLFRI